MKFGQLIINDFDFLTKLDTRWSDMDSLGHINHTSYLTYMETARVDTYVQLGFASIDKNMNESTILASMEITYLSQLAHPTSLIVGHRITRVGNKSYDLMSGIFQESSSVILCHAYFKLVSFNYKKNKTIVVPDIIRKNCRPLEL
tara:strand:- start:88 stop:522 length:435 start_codon:yes stop_codon:yes gene_type:complete